MCMRRTDAPPMTLEVAADIVHWDWDGWWPVVGQHGGVNGPATIASAVSQVSVRTARLEMHCVGEPANISGPGPCTSPTPEEALGRILHHAAPALRACSLGPACTPDSAGPQSWRVELAVTDASPKRQTSMYGGAAELFEGLQPHAAAHVRLQLNEGRQGVRVIRAESA